MGSMSDGEGKTKSLQEEFYPLLAHPEGSTLPFAMTIRLTPEILKVLKCAEAKCVAPRMKFADNIDGCVIEVGPENCQFSSAPESDVCYIYAEQADENGKHILREYSSTTIQCILSAKKKEQCTAEEETKQKLQKSVLVDQISQVNTPQVPLAEADSRKALLGMGKEPPPKKRKIMCQLPSTSSSPCLLPELKSTILKEASEIPLKGKPTNGGEVFHPLHSEARTTHKERTLMKTVSAGSNINIMDMRNLLISLLQETPKGMTLRALEKAVTEGLGVNPERKLIEKVIKSMATFHAPGKYILNHGVEKETFVDAVIGSSGKSNKINCVETLEEKPIINLMIEPAIQEELNLDLPKASHNKSQETPANADISTHPVDSYITNEFVGQSPTTGAMDAEVIASGGSDSSSTNESESESGTSSKGSATSASESSSGSESDGSIGSSDPSTDEYVDIMSDGEDKTRFDMNHQKLKGEDVKLEVKEASKLQDDFENTEGIDSETLEKRNASLEFRSNSPGEVCLPLEDTKVKERECAADSLHETVFEPEKDAGLLLDSNVLLKDGDLKSMFNPLTLRDEASFQVSPISQMPLNKQMGDTFPAIPESHQERGLHNEGSDWSTSVSHMEARAGKRAKQVDISVNKIYEDKDVVSDSNWYTHQTTYQNSSSKVPEMVEKSEPEQQPTKQEARQQINKENSTFNPNGDNSSSKNSILMLEASTDIFVGSSLQTKDMLLKAGKRLREANSVDELKSKQHSDIELNKLITKQRKKLDKEADKDKGTGTKSSECSLRTAPQIASASSGPGEKRKFSRSLHHNRSREFLGKDDHGCSKEDVSKSSISKLTNSGESLPRRGTSLRAQQSSRKDVGAKKPTIPSFTRESGTVQDALELGSINKDGCKASQCNCLEWAERSSSVEEQVERPHRDACLSKQANEYTRKDDSKETGLKERLPNNGMLSGIASKEGRRMETGNIDSGHVLNSSYYEGKICDSQDLELGELREPLSETEVGESKSPVRPLQPVRDPPAFHGTSPSPAVMSEKHCYEATSRATLNSRSVSPDSKTKLPRSKLEISPAQGENNILQEWHGSERITQDARRAEPCRPLKKNEGPGHSKQKQGADQVKKSQRGRLVSTNIDLGGSRRSGGAHMAGSKETSRILSNKLLGNSNTCLSQQKARNATRKLQEAHDAEDFRISCRKQTSQSSEVHGGEYFALYEKEQPELRGAIYSLDQFRDYYEEFGEKYPVYTQLNASLENIKENFEMFRKDIEAAKRRGDMAKLAIIYGIVRKEYLQCHKRSKRMRHTFKVLHEELQVIKQHCKDYAQKSRRWQ